MLCQNTDGTPARSLEAISSEIHALGGEYNIKNIDMPFGILPKTLEGRHYEGWSVGGGLTYEGYQWLLE